MVENNLIEQRPEFYSGPFGNACAEIVNIQEPLDIRYFEKWMRRSNMADNTIAAYTWVIQDYINRFKIINKNNLLAYRIYMIERFNPRTVNQRIQGINKYLEYIRKKQLALKCVRIQQKPFVENVISDADYKFFVRKLKKDEHYTMYFITKYMACTGARVSEVIKIKAEHITQGFVDIYSKGGKLRRLYFPKKLQEETLTWLQNIGINTGYIFLNKNGIQISTRGIAKELKLYAEEYGSIPLDTVYPHSFRHRFAMNFLEKYNGLVLLSDLLGHSSVETTRIYLRLTSNQQRAIINKVVTW